MAIRLKELPAGWDDGLAKGKGRFAVAPKWQRTLDGIVFDSKGEMNRWAVLKLNERSGLIRNLRRQVTFPIEVGGILICVYKADFVFEVSDTGQVVVEDLKSTGTAKDPTFKLKQKLMKAVHGVDVTVKVK